MENEQIDQALQPIEEAMKDFPRIDLTEEDWQRVKWSSAAYESF